MMKTVAIIVLVLIFGSLAVMFAVMIGHRLFGRRLTEKIVVLCILTLFCAIIVFGAVIAGVAGADTWESWSSRSWQPTPAEVVQSSFVIKQKKDCTHYYLNVKYRYSVDGIAYESDRMGFRDTPIYRKNEVQAQLDKTYAVGTELVAYVNPRKPSTAILQPGLSWHWLTLTCFGVSFVVGGLLGMRRWLMYGPLS